MRTKELLGAAGQGKLHPQWDGPFTVRARQCLNIYTLALRRRMRRCPSIACKPSLRVPGRMGQEGEHEVELMLNRRLARGVTHYRVRCQGAHVCRRRVGAGGGAGSLPRQGREIRPYYDASAPRRRSEGPGPSPPL